MSKITLLICFLTLSLNNQAAPRNSELSDNKANILAALIYKLYFYVDYNADKAVPNYCFIGDNADKIAQSLRNERAQGNIKLFIKISNWSRMEDIKEKQCHVLYSSPTSKDHIDRYEALSQHTLTISDSTNLRETGNMTAITLTESGPVLTFSRRNLRRSVLQVNSQLIRNSIVLP